MDFFTPSLLKGISTYPNERGMTVTDAISLFDNLDLIKNIFTDDFLWLLIPIRYRQRYQDICHSFYGITQSAQSVRKLFQHVPQV